MFSWIFRLIARLPLGLVHGLGAWVGSLTYRLSGRYRRQMLSNLAIAGYGPEEAGGVGGAGALPREAAREAGKAMLELPYLWLRPPATVAARVTQVSGWAAVEAAWAAGQGLIFLTPHLGCFEITAQYYAEHCQRQSPITVLYRPPRKAWLEPLMRQGRSRANLHLAPADLAGVRRLIRALKQGEAVGLLPDQAPGAGQGAWLPFFGKPAYTMTLAARLTETGAAVIFAWAERLPGGQGYHLRLRPPRQPLAGDTLTRAVAINGEIEALVRECPGQYLWGYNRYKRPAGAEPPPSA